MIDLFGFELSYLEVGTLFLVALFIGMAKTGIHGTGMAAVPLLALVFGGRESTGIMLPILCLADLFAVSYYHRYAKWNHLAKLLPWALIGVLIGTYVGKQIDDSLFRLIMGFTILISLAIMIWQEKSKVLKIPSLIWFAPLLGVLGGFTTMVGNLAGSVMALYLLTMRFPKNEYIGTAAWFFLLLNWFKLPLHIFIWGTITKQSVLLDLVTLPLIGLGAWIGVYIVKKIPEQYYRWFIIATTLLASILMVL